MVAGSANLARNRVRLLVSVGGVALALSLTYSPSTRSSPASRGQLTSYIDRSGARGLGRPVWRPKPAHGCLLAAQLGDRSGPSRRRRHRGPTDPLLDRLRSRPATSGRAYVIGLPARTRRWAVRGTSSRDRAGPDPARRSLTAGSRSSAGVGDRRSGGGARPRIPDRRADGWNRQPRQLGRVRHIRRFRARAVETRPSATSSSGSPTAPRPTPSPRRSSLASTG